MALPAFGPIKMSEIRNEYTINGTSNPWTGKTGNDYYKLSTYRLQYHYENNTSPQVQFPWPQISFYNFYRTSLLLE